MQTVIAKKALSLLISLNHSQHASPRIISMTGGILHNISKNRLNRTRIYKAELKFKAKWVQQRSAAASAKPKTKAKAKAKTKAEGAPIATLTPIKPALDQENSLFTKRNLAEVVDTHIHTYINVHKESSSTITMIPPT